MGKIFIINDTSITGGVASTHDLGTSSLTWKDAYLSGTITVGSTSVSGTLTVGTVSATGNIISGTKVSAASGSFTALLTAGTASISGAIIATSGSILNTLTVGTVSATGNVIVGGRVNLASVASSGAAGDIWFDSTQKTLQSFTNGMRQTLSNVVFVQTVDVTVSNSTAETTVLGAGVGTLTLPASFFTVGRTLRLSAHGFHSAGGNPSIQAKIKLGSATILDSTAVTSGNSTNAGLEISGVMTCRTSGASGVIHGQGKLREEHSTGVVTGMTRTASTTIDLTTALAIDVTLQWGAASTGNTATITNFVVEALN